MLERNSIVAWVWTGVMAVAGLFGAITFKDTYQGLSFVVLILTAIKLVIDIRRNHGEGLEGKMSRFRGRIVKPKRAKRADADDQ